MCRSATTEEGSTISPGTASVHVAVPPASREIIAPSVSRLSQYKKRGIEVNCTVSPADILPPSTTTLAVVLQSSLSQALVGENVDRGVADLLKSMQGNDGYDQFVLTTFSYERTTGKFPAALLPSSLFSRYPECHPYFHFCGLHPVSNGRQLRQISVFSVEVSPKEKFSPTPNNIQDPMGALVATFKNNTFYNSALFLFVDAQPKDTSSTPDIL